MNDKIQVVVVEPGKTARVELIEATLEAMQEIVGGDIEITCPLDDEVALIRNNSDGVNTLPLNRAIPSSLGAISDIVAGTFFLADGSKEELGSLSDKQVEKYLEMFFFPERFSKIGDEDVIPIKYMHF